MPKNTMSKTRDLDDPYEIWEAPGWEWRMLNKWLADDYKPDARWFVAVKSSFTHGSYEMGDSFAKDI